MKNLNFLSKSSSQSCSHSSVTLASTVGSPSVDRRLTKVKHLAFVLLFMLGSLNVWGATSTLTFTAKCNGSGTANDGASWTVTSDGGTEQQFESDRGIHYGANKTSVQYIKLLTSDISGTITKVVVNASAASGVTATVAVKVGTTDFNVENSDNTTASLTTTATNYTFTGSASGDILVTITKPSKANKALYCKSVAVTYTSTPATITLSEAGAERTVSGTRYAGDSYSLPTSTDATCGSKVLVGWSTVTVTEINTKPTSNYFDKGTSVTLAGGENKFYAVFATASAGGGSNTESVTWSDRYSENKEVEGSELTIETNAKVTHNKGTNNNKCQYYTTGTGIRVYGGGNFVVTAPGNITAIDLSFGSGDGTNAITTDVGTYTNGSWAGSATSVTFSVGGTSGHRRISGISVTYSGGTTYSNYATSCCEALSDIDGSVSASTATSVNLEWDKIANADGTTPYEVEVSPNAGVTVGSIDLSGSKATCAITGMTPCTDYTISIKANGATGYCDASQAINHTTIGYSYTKSLTDVTLKSGGVTSTCDGDYEAVFQASTGYALPENITVSNAGEEGTGWIWDNSDGSLFIDKASVTGNVEITIVGVLSAVAEINVSKSAINFDDVKKGVAASTTFTVSGANLSDANITLSYEAVEGDNIFTFSKDALTPSEYAGEGTEITLSANTATAGDFAGTITVKSGTTSKTIDVNLTVLQTYTVNWYVNGTKIDANSITDVVGTAVPAPSDFSAFTDCQDLTFVGWKEGSAIDGGSTTEAPSLADVVTTIPETNKNYYAVFAEGTPGSAQWEKATSVAAGEYLIVYETDGVAFDGGLLTLDAVGNTIAVTIDNNNTIAYSEATEAAKFTIAAVTGGHSIKSASGKYVGQEENANGLPDLTTAVTNTITIEDGDADIVSSSAHLRYNSASNQTRFRYYKSASYSSQKAIQLYKKNVSPANFTKWYTTCPHCNSVALSKAGESAGNTFALKRNSADVTSVNTCEDVTVDVVASPATGYELAGIELSELSGASYNSETGKIELTAGTNGDLTVTATFSQKNYSVTLNHTEGVDPVMTGATDEAHYDGTINLTTTIPSNAIFVNWTSSDVTITNATSATEASFTMPAKDVTVTANFTVVHNVAWAIENTPSSSSLANVYVKGIVKANPNVETSYGNATYYICDLDANGEPTNEFYVYRGKNVGNTDFTNVNQLTEGDEVVIYGTLKNHQGTKEFDANNYIIANGRKAATVSSVVVSAPDASLVQTDYYTGDNFSFAGFKATAVYNTGYQKDVTAAATWKANNLASYTVSANGEIDVTATYGDKTSDNYPVAVTVTTKVLESISLSEDALTGYKGIALPKPATVTAHFDDQGVKSTENVTGSAVFDEDDAYSATSTEAQTIVVKYTFGLNTRTANYTVTLSSIENDLATAYPVTKAREIIDLDRVAGNNLDLANADNKVYVVGRITAKTNDQITIKDDADETKVLYLWKYTGITSVEVGDLIKAYGNLYYFENSGKYELNEGCEIVWKQPKVELTFANKTVEVGERWSISGTITPEEASVTYSIKEGSDDCITLSSSDEITATAEGTATIVVEAEAYGDYLANSTEFTVTVYPAGSTKDIVILAQYRGEWLALKHDLTYQVVDYRFGKLYDVENPEDLVWTRSIAAGKATFKAGDKYIKGSTSTTLSVGEGETGAYKWTWKETENGNYYTTNTTGTIRTILYQGGTADKFSNYAISNAKTGVGPEESYSALPIYVDAEFNTTYTRPNVIANQLGTICLPNGGKMVGATPFEIHHMDYDGSGNPYKIYFDEVEEMVAGRPYVFLPEGDNTDVKVYYTDTENAPAGDYKGLYGTYEDIYPLAQGYYIIYNNMYYNVNTANVKVLAYRAYIKLSEVPDYDATQTIPAGTKAPRRISIGNGAPAVATGIDELNASETPVKMMIDGELFILRGEKMYDATGRLVK